MQKHKLPHSFAVLILILLFSQSVVYAQQRFSAGPRLGANLSKFVGSNVAENKMIGGLAAGAFIMYSSLNHFGISADLLYSQKGAKFTGIGLTNVTQRVNYLEVPVALRYFLTRSGDFRPNLFVGPAVGFRLNASQKAENTGLSVTNTQDVKSVDVGLMAGFQLNFKGLGDRQRFLIDGRYTYGLSGINVVSGNTHNSAFTLALGYGFGIGREFKSPARR